MEKKVGLVILTIAALSLGCGAPQNAPRTTDDKQIEVVLFFDSGTPGQAVLPGEVPLEAREEERGELAMWMVNDLARLLNDAGYGASALKSLEGYRPGSQRCLLKILLKSYIPADRASRLEAGFGEGQVQINLHYELFIGEGAKERRLFSNDRGLSSARGWEWVGGELNEKIAADITRRLKEALK